MTQSLIQLLKTADVHKAKVNTFTPSKLFFGTGPDVKFKHWISREGLKRWVGRINGSWIMDHV